MFYRRTTPRPTPESIKEAYALRPEKNHGHVTRDGILRANAAKGDMDMVIRLLGRGADPRTRNAHELSAIDLARSAGHHEIVQLLEEKAAELDKKNVTRE